MTRFACRTSTRSAAVSIASASPVVLTRRMLSTVRRRRHRARHRFCDEQAHRTLIGLIGLGFARQRLDRQDHDLVRTGGDRREVLLDRQRRRFDLRLTRRAQTSRSRLAAASSRRSTSAHRPRASGSAPAAPLRSRRQDARRTRSADRPRSTLPDPRGTAPRDDRPGPVCPTGSSKLTVTVARHEPRPCRRIEDRDLLEPNVEQALDRLTEQRGAARGVCAAQRPVADAGHVHPQQRRKQDDEATARSPG